MEQLSGHLHQLVTHFGYAGLFLVMILGNCAVPVVEKYGRYVHFDTKKLAQVHAYYERFGTPTVFWCRFIPFVRGFSSLPAGISRMEKRYFFPFTLAGSAIFSFGLAYLGEVAGKNLDAILGSLHKAALAIVIVVVLLVIAAALVVRARTKRSAAGGG